MRQIKLAKVVLHCSTSDQKELERCIKLLKLISGNKKPVKTFAKKRIPAFKIRPGLPIGCKVTIRGGAKEILATVLTGIPHLSKENFTGGQLSFGIHEYIEIPSIQFQRDIGILGFDITAVLERPGFNIRKRKGKKGRVGKTHRITKEETIKFFEDNFKINFEEENDS